jgi:FkbM family methyltransferase
VGAYDGLTNDPLHAYVRRHGWRGVLVEPQEAPFQALKANYSDQGQLTFLNAAVGNRDGTGELYVVPEAAGQPEWSRQIASFRREVILKHDHDRLAVAVPRGVEHLSEILETRKVNVITFDTLIERFGIDRIDLLQIDAEGYDAELLKQFDFKRLKPAIIRYEHVHLEKEEQRDCLELLAGHGYRFSVGNSDSLAYLP